MSELFHIALSVCCLLAAVATPPDQIQHLVPLLYWFIISAQTMFAQYVIFKPLIGMSLHTLHTYCMCHETNVLQQHWKQLVGSVLMLTDYLVVILMKILNVAGVERSHQYFWFFQILNEVAQATEKSMCTGIDHTRWRSSYFKMPMLPALWVKMVRLRLKTHPVNVRKR